MWNISFSYFIYILGFVIKFFVTVVRVTSFFDSFVRNTTDDIICCFFSSLEVGAALVSFVLFTADV